MKRNLPAFLLPALGLLMGACNNNNAATNASSSDTATDSIYPPVETLKANSDYQPAFSGQTRIS